MKGTSLSSILVYEARVILAYQHVHYAHGKTMLAAVRRALALLREIRKQGGPVHLTVRDLEGGRTCFRAWHRGVWTDDKSREVLDRALYLNSLRPR